MIIRLIYLLIKKTNNLLYRLFVNPIKVKLLKSSGKKVYISRKCDITYKNVIMGNNVYVGPGCYLLSPKNKIYIGDDVMFGPSVYVISSNHKTDEIGAKIISQSDNKLDTGRDVIIGNDVWIGANAIILQGVKIGEGSIIGAGSIVTKDIPPFSIYTGTQEVRIRSRFDTNDLIKHKKILSEGREK